MKLVLNYSMQIKSHNLQLKKKQCNKILDIWCKIIKVFALSDRTFTMYKANDVQLNSPWTYINNYLLFENNKVIVFFYQICFERIL